jgi:hypothetical protein
MPRVLTTLAEWATCGTSGMMGRCPQCLKMIWFADHELIAQRAIPDEHRGAHSNDRSHSEMVTIRVGFCPECVQRIELP